MDKIYYVKRENIIQTTNKIGLYEKTLPEETEARIIDWPFDYYHWVKNTNIEVEPGEAKKIRIRIEEIIEVP